MIALATATKKAKVTEKRLQLTAIVERLGPDAAPAQIREEAYRVGFGAVHPAMLIDVRNKLWPDRPRRSGGYSRVQRQADSERDKIAGRAIPCPQCGSTRVAYKQRYVQRGGLVTRHRLCTECGHKFKTVDDGPLRSRESNRIQWAILTEKACTYCKRILPIDRFSLQTGSDVVRRPGCKECAANKRATYDERDLLKKYGITPDDYRAMLAKQNGRCAICLTDNPFGRLDNNVRQRKRRTFSVDHCHTTGKVRGLLCARCNIAIGNFYDDPELMRAAADYVGGHRNG